MIHKYRELNVNYSLFCMFRVRITDFVLKYSLEYRLKFLQLHTHTAPLTA